MPPLRIVNGIDDPVQEYEHGINGTGYRRASATESARLLPRRVRKKFPLDFLSNPSEISSSVSFSFNSDAATPLLVLSESAIRSVHFISLVRRSLDPCGD
jgi:hypothetical protein